MFEGTFNNWIFSLDYYDIEVKDYIGQFQPQEILDGCYTYADQAKCDAVVRQFGTLTFPSRASSPTPPTLTTSRSRAWSSRSRSGPVSATTAT